MVNFDLFGCILKTLSSFSSQTFVEIYSNEQVHRVEEELFGKKSKSVFNFLSVQEMGKLSHNFFRTALGCLIPQMKFCMQT